MKKLIHIGLLMLIVLGMFLFCITSEANCSTVTQKNISQDAPSSVNNMGTLHVHYSGPSIQPCGPGSGGGQGPNPPSLKP